MRAQVLGTVGRSPGTPPPKDPTVTDADVRCRCSVLNNLSGAVANEYARTHLDTARTDGMGRRIHRCPDTTLEWTEDRRAQGYGKDIVVLRRLTR